MNQRRQQPCAGATTLTPMSVRNRPGKDRLKYRAGTHAAFLDTMIAQLSSKSTGSSHLTGLQTRDPDDAAIALLDSWSVIGDILTFYQERLANEGFLATADDRSSIERLAQLVGYRLKPGLSASTYLSFQVEKDAGEIIVPAGTPAQTVPGQNETPQTFETRFDITAREEWNEILPKVKRLPNITPANADLVETITLDGVNLGLAPDDVLMFRFLDDTSTPRLRRIRSAASDSTTRTTRITFYPASVSHHRFTRRLLPFVQQLDAKISEFRVKTSAAAGDHQPAIILGSAVANGVTPLEMIATDIRKLLLEVGPQEGTAKLDRKLSGYDVDTVSPLAVLSKKLDDLKTIYSDAEVKVGAARKQALSPAADATVKTFCAVDKQVQAVTDTLKPDTTLANAVKSLSLGNDAVDAAVKPGLKAFKDADASATARSKAFLDGAVKIIISTPILNLADTNGVALVALFDHLATGESRVNAMRTSNGNWIDTSSPPLKGPLIIAALAQSRIPVRNDNEAVTVAGTGEAATNLLASTLHRFCASALADLIDKCGEFVGPLQVLRAETEWLGFTGRVDSGNVQSEVERLFKALKKDNHPGLGGSTYGKDLLKALREKNFDNDGQIVASGGTPLAVMTDDTLRLRYPVVEFLGRCIDSSLDGRQTQGATLTFVQAVNGIFDSLTSDISRLNNQLSVTLPSDPDALCKDAQPFLTELDDVIKDWPGQRSLQYPGVQKAVIDIGSRLKSLKKDYLERLKATVTKFEQALPTTLDVTNSTQSMLGAFADLKNVRLLQDWPTRLRSSTDRSSTYSTVIGLLQDHAAVTACGPVLNKDSKDQPGLQQSIHKTRRDVGQSLRDQIKREMLSGDLTTTKAELGTAITNLEDLMDRVAPDDSWTVDEIETELRKVQAAMFGKKWISDPAKPPVILNGSHSLMPQLLRERLVASVVNRVASLGPRTEAQLITLNEQQDGMSRLPRFLPTLQDLLRRSTVTEHASRLKSANRGAIASDSDARLLGLLSRDLTEDVLRALKEEPAISPRYSVIGFREPAAIFGHNAAEKKLKDDGTRRDWQVDDFDEADQTVFLSRVHASIHSGQWIVVQPEIQPGTEEETSVDDLKVLKLTGTTEESRAKYDISVQCTRLQLGSNWFDSKPTTLPEWLKLLRSTSVLVGNEELQPRAETYPFDIGVIPHTASDLLETGPDEIECSRLLSGLRPGQKVIISGTRKHAGTENDEGAELVGVQHIWRDWPGEKPHTRLTFTKPLLHAYKRDTVKIYANVAEATHGETHREIVGSGFAAKPMQKFELSRPDLTHLPDEDAVAAKAELEVRVNDVQWDAANNVLQLEREQRYIPSVYSSRTRLQFGDGEHGVRLPTGIENVRAIYRTGIGRVGNAKREQVSQMPAPVLGVQSVTNPLPGSGGVDPESIYLARHSTSRHATSLGAVISLPDVEDFARSFGGISKATAISDGIDIKVYVAAADDAVLSSDSLLIRKLTKTLNKKAQTTLPITVLPRIYRALQLTAHVAIDPKLNSETILRQIRSALLNQFSFERCEFGLDIPQSRVFAVLQQIPGVQFARISRFNGVDEDAVTKKLEAGKSGSTADVVMVVPVKREEIAYFTPEVPETIELLEVPQ